ncbi:hypothetical protein PBS_35480 [Paraburkholderia sp. 2C]|jgi:quercetin dioxygenase-like cupin family protein
MTAENSLKPLVVTAAEAIAIKPFGLDMQIMLTTEQGGGALSIILVSHRPGEGPPDHLHRSQEECIFIVDGTYEVAIDGATRVVGGGTLLFIPRGVTHRFKNIGTTVGHMLDWSLPGGQDKYFKAISDLMAIGQFGTLAAKELSARFDTHFMLVP